MITQTAAAGEKSGPIGTARPGTEAVNLARLVNLNAEPDALVLLEELEYLIGVRFVHGTVANALFHLALFHDDRGQDRVGVKFPITNVGRFAFEDCPRGPCEVQRSL